jgi:hypothetical protein
VWIASLGELDGLSVEVGQRGDGRMEGWKGSTEGKRRERALGRKGHHPPRCVGSFMREGEECVWSEASQTTPMWCWNTTTRGHAARGVVNAPIWQWARTPMHDKLSARLISRRKFYNGVGTGQLVQNTPKTGHAMQACWVTWRLGLAQACARKGHDIGEEERSSTLKDRDIKGTKWHCCVDSKSA